MASSRERRIHKELLDMQTDNNNSDIRAWPIHPSDVTHLKGTFRGPPDTPYAGGIFQVDIRIPDSYPFKSPQMKFDTKIWHPNVSSVTGAICLDTLTTGWSPVGTMKMALLSLRMLLESPNAKDPQDAEVAKQLIEKPVEFANKAHEWAVRFAGAPLRPGIFAQYLAMEKKLEENRIDDPSRYNGYNKNMIDKFVNMGFDIDAVVEAFAFVGIDRNGGQDYELEEAYMGDITARLLGEQ